jgi:hypothetical protein
VVPEGLSVSKEILVRSDQQNCSHRAVERVGRVLSSYQPVEKVRGAGN